MGKELRVLGWIVEESPRPFWWSSSGKEVFFDEEETEGSGAEVFLDLLNNRGTTESGGGFSQVEGAYVSSLSTISKLLTIEARHGIPLQQGFGFCYDIVVWDKYRFKNIPSYTQVNIDFSLDTKSKSGRYNFAQPVLIYKSSGQFAEFSAVRWSEKQNANLSFSMSGLEPTIIPPVWEVPEIPRPKKPKFHSKYICVFFNVVDELGRSFIAPYCISDESKRGDGVWLTKQGSKEGIALNTSLIEKMHAAVFGGS